MKQKFYSIFQLLASLILLASIFQLLASPIHAATGANNFLTFQGKMVNTDGTNVTDGVYDFVFTIYDSAASSGTSQFTESWTNAALFTSTMTTAPSANGESLVYTSNTNESSLKVGQILWNITRGEAVTITSVNTGSNTLGISPTRQAWSTSDTITNRIYVKDGIFRVALNSLNQSSTFATVFSDDTRFLGINFNNDGEMRPRVRLTATPYAMNAASLGSIDASGYLRSNTSDNYTSGTLAFDSGTTLDVNGDLSIADTNIAFDGASTTFTTTGAFTLNTGGTITLGDGGDNIVVNSNNWDVSSTGVITGATWNGTAIGSQYGGTGQNWSAVAQGSIPYFSGTGIMSTLAPSTAGYVLTTNGTGANPTWVDPSIIANTNNYWQLTSQQLAPKNTTFDIMTGGTATASAKFYAQGTTGNGYFAGNLGIGTTNPTGKLQVNTLGINQTNTYISQTNTTNLIMGIVSTDYGLYTRINNSGSITDDAYDVGTGRISFGNYIQITDSGALNNDGGTAFKELYGIYSSVQDTGTHTSGTSDTIAAFLSAQGTATNVNGTAYGLKVRASGADANYAIYSESGTNYFSDSVGIGTTNPGYKLEVAGGDLNLTTGTFRMAGIDYGQYFIDSAGTNGYVWTSDGSGRGIWAPSAMNYWQLNAQQLAPINTTFDIMTGGTATASAKFYAQGTTGNGYFAGNLGIGTTAPANKLSVVGNASIGSSTYNVAAPTNGLIVEGNVGIGTTNPSEKLQVGGKAIIRTDALLYDINSHPSSQLTITTDTNQDNYFAGIKFIANNQSSNSSIAWIGTYATGIQSNLVFGTRSGSYYSEKMRIDIAGNLGIGTTNPGYKLEVAGGDLNLTTGTFRMAGIDYGQYFIDSAGTNGYVWTSDGSGRGYWATAPGGSTYTAGNDIDINGTQLDLESQLDFVSTISRDSSNLTLQTTTSGNIYLTSAGSVNVTGDFILTGKASSASTTEGTLYYDTDDDQLKVYANGKWQADRTTATLIVAASDSKNKEKADYVADGTDDQTEINAAINALPSTGGTVVLLDGTYNLGNGSAGRITIAKSNVSLVGSGASTVIKRMFDESGDNGLIVIGNGSGTYTKIAVSNLSVDGNNGTYSNSYNHGIYATNTTNYVNLTNNWINNNGGFGIYFSSTYANRYNITGNYIAANTEGGIYAVTYYLNIANNQFIQNGSWGTSGYDIYSPDSGSSITNNVFYLPQYRGIRLSANNVTVGNNTFRGCANYCLFLDSAVNNTITGNTFYQDGSHTAIAVSGSSRNTIANNNINELGNTRNGILLTGSSTNNTLTGNQIYSTNTSAGAAIQIDSGSTGNYLSSNRFSGTGTAAQGTNVLTDSATGTIYGGQTTNGNSNYAFTPTGNVGIGTTGPSSKLSVGGAGVAGAGIYGIGTTYGLYGESTDALGYGVRGYAQSTGTGVFGSNNSTGYGVIGSNTNSGIGGYFTSTSGHALVTGTGNVGIGTTNPSYKFQVRIDASNEGHVDSTGAWARSSDVRLKQNITTLTDSLSKVMNLRAVRYDSTTDTLSAPGYGKHIGFIAQELEQIYPEFVNTDDNGIKSVAYESLTPVLTAAIQELNVKLNDAGNVITNLQTQTYDLTVTQATHTNLLSDLVASIQSLFARQTVMETSLADLQTQIATLSTTLPSPTPIPSPSPTPTPNALITEVATLSARISYLEQRVTGQLAPTPVPIATVAGTMDSAPVETRLTDLESRLASLSATVDLSLQLTASQSALIDTLSTAPTATTSSVANDLNLDAQSLFVSDFLSVMGDTVLTNATITNTLTLNSITAPDGHIDLLAGLMTLDATGNLVIINGDVAITGDLTVLGNTHLNQAQVNQLTFVSTASDAAIASAAASLTADTTGLRLNLTASDAAFRIADSAAISASGSAKFAELAADSLRIDAETATPAATANGPLLTTTASAGTTQIPEGYSHVTINNPKITLRTLIYVTPLSSTNNRTLYVKLQTDGQVVIGFDTPNTAPVSFNWWLVEPS